MKLLTILLGLAALAFFAAATAWIAYHLTNLQSILNGVYDPLIITASSITILVGVLAGISIFFLYKKASLDLRQRKRTEEALMESEANYRAIFNAANDAIFIYDLETEQILNMNQKMCEMTGYNPEEAGRLSAVDLSSGVAPYTPEGALELITKAVDGDPQLFEWMAKDKSGRLFWVEVNLKKTTIREKARLVAVVRDISKRKQIEEALRESRQRYQAVSELISDYAYAYRVEPDGELINEWVTGAFIGITGFTKEEVRLRGGWENLIYQDDISIPLGQLKALQNNQSTTVEYRIVTKNGDVHWMRDHARPVWDNMQGRLSHIFGAVQDITEQKRAEDEKIKLESQLGQAQKMEAIGTLAGGIAHDFNNILAAIIGYSELALPEAKKGTVLYNNLNEVIHAGGRAKDLVKQILTFSRQAHQELKPVQVNLLIKEAVKFLRASLPTSIEIHQDIQSDSLVMADPTQIHQVIMNLCANAEHAMREKGGVLRVELTDVKIESDFSSEHSELKPGQYLKLTISDTGHGMPSQLMDRIFDPFFTTKEKGEGTGMGLAVVHGIISRSAGTVKVSSMPGKSTTFMVYLPVVKSQFESQVKYEEPVATGSERILLVDDELAIVEMGKQTLGSLGYEVTARTSSYEALELFKAKPDRFDLVITDMTMPNLTGDDLAKELIRIKPDIPIIICTGYSARINKEQALAMGIRAFVSKPVLRRDIAKTIREVLDKK